jgi:MOB kinase activator 1
MEKQKSKMQGIDKTKSFK